MPLSPGDKLGHYEIASLLGKGGMGEVYRARDTQLKREVALKILSPSFAADAERIARFQREAEVLASLNHPNIAHLYGLAESEGIRALVMELVEGESPQGPMPFDDAWKVMTQVAAGLEYAHERRIVHRDLKPANLKITADGRVKILDFGLAKALAGNGRAAASAAGPDSPTLTMGATQAGVILGTAAYMAPEQIKGKEADRRADIWAFGVVLCELLTGERPFKGKDSTEIMARAVTSEPVVDKAPARVKRLLAKCLQKDPEDRLSWIGDARMLLEEDSAPAVASTTQLRHRPWPALFARTTALFAATTALFLWLWLRPTPREPDPVVRIAAQLPAPLARAVIPIAISRDGSRMAFVGRGGQIYYRAMDQLEARPLPGADITTSGIRFSPDGRQIAYVTGNLLFGPAQIKKVDLAGGSVQTLASVVQTRGPAILDWGDDGNILYVDSVGLGQVLSTGGNPTSLLKPDSKQGEIFFPSVQSLPGGKQILLSIFTGPLGMQVVAFNPETGTKKPLLELRLSPFLAQFIPSGISPASGYIAYHAPGTASIMAVPLDLKHLTVSGGPVPVLDGVASTIQGAPFGAFAVSNNGTLIYVSGGSPTEIQSTRLGRVDRKGTEQLLDAPPRAYRSAAASPADPNRILVTLSHADGGSDVWVYDSARGTLDRIGAAGTDYPVWTPDGKRVIFHGVGGSDRHSLMWAPVDRSAPPSLLAEIEGHAATVPVSVSPDAKLLFGYYRDEGKIWTFPLPGQNGEGAAKVQPTMILDSDFRENRPEISPDGHWLAYESLESGTGEITVTSYPQAGPRITISTGGGREPHWSRNGRELLYSVAPTTARSVLAVDVDPGPPFRAGRPKELFHGEYLSIEPERDGQHFLAVKLPPVTPQGAADQVTIVFNWQEELRRRAPFK